MCSSVKETGRESITTSEQQASSVEDGGGAAGGEAGAGEGGKAGQPRPVSTGSDHGSGSVGKGESHQKTSRFQYDNF